MGPAEPGDPACAMAGSAGQVSDTALDFVAVASAGPLAQLAFQALPTVAQLSAQVPKIERLVAPPVELKDTHRLTLTVDDVDETCPVDGHEMPRAREKLHLRRDRQRGAINILETMRLRKIRRFPLDGAAGAPRARTT